MQEIVHANSSGCMSASLKSDALSTRVFSTREGSFVKDGKKVRILSGELHYFRIPREYWRHRLKCARAMGLNTISTYMPWNLHEPHPGKFNFQDMLDVRAFIDLAREEKLMVILRPGPYICAEWDFGGLPPWLLAIPDIRVRCMDERWLTAVQGYFRRVGLECAELQYQRGGPVIMVQVENEYGAYGNDRSYMNYMVNLVRQVGFDGLLYTCDWAKPANMNAGEVSGAVTVANFGSRAHEQIPALRILRPDQPAMCGEFWAGWFDTWGAPRKGSDDPAPILSELQWMLANDCSFNFYMFHGGTSFGLMAGANHYETYTPTVSSYDYRAPLDEAGRPCEKFHAIRKLLASYQGDCEGPLSEIPAAPMPLISIPGFFPQESAALFDNLPVPIEIPQPVPMEALGQSYGLILYRTEIAGLGDQELRLVEAHDFAQVRLNGNLVGCLDRGRHEFRLDLKNVPCDVAQLDLLIDTMGRTNFGSKLLDRKGITDRVEYGGLTLMGWKAYRLPLDAAMLSSLKYQADDCGGPAFHRASFILDMIGDTFLDLSAWGRGVVWINDRCLSRFWSIGPQQTCFLPGSWLRKGKNQIVVFDAEGGGRKALAGLEVPVLGKMQR